MISPSLTVSSLFPGSAAKSYRTRACWEWKGKEVTNVNLVKKPTTFKFPLYTCWYEQTPHDSGCHVWGERRHITTRFRARFCFGNRRVLVTAHTAFRDWPPKSPQNKPIASRGKRHAPPSQEVRSSNTGIVQYGNSLSGTGEIHGDIQICRHL